MASSTFPFQHNVQAHLAIDYIEKTNAHLFITGKAGTGKTTFLKYIKKAASKRCVVVAPTGVAALNAEGVTIHSFFGLPFSPFVPNESNSNFQNHLSPKKIEVIQNVELLIIDEISMVRADILDAIDAALRHYRKDHSPFGGIQLVMIGDLHQLPPVVTEADRLILSSFYPGFYFFESHALKKLGFATIEFTQIYRQQDARFIELLNVVRENKLSGELLSLLKTRYIANFHSDEHIILTTHNNQAQQINNAFLSAINHSTHRYDAMIQGNFPESMFPTDAYLELKEGARVMFLKNDVSGEKLFYNGKIGIIESLHEKTISIRCEGESDPIMVQPMEWQNIHYVYNNEKREIEEEILGTFVQYPLKLAWAITIHKSQGLTFDKVIIDGKNAFAHGQIYVALSRCRSLEGVILSSMFNEQAIIVDAAVSHFMKVQKSKAPNEHSLALAEKEYFAKGVSELFDFSFFQIKWQMIVEAVQFNRDSLKEFDFDALNKANYIFNQQINRLNHEFLNWFSDELSSNDHDLSIFQNRIKTLIPQYLETFTEFTSLIKGLKIKSENKKLSSDIRLTKKELLKNLSLKIVCLELSKNGFSTQKYRQTVAAFERENKEKSKVVETDQKHSTSSQRLHQTLYSNIIAWRNAKSIELQKEPYDVLRQISVEKIVSLLPSSKKELASIKEIGNKRIEQFGDEILEIVTDYLMEQGLMNSPAVSIK
ncbi:MAG: AAA family ATPase [Microbacter sp.]